MPPYYLGRGLTVPHTASFVQASEDLCQSRSFRNLLDLAKQEVRQAHARLSGTGFQGAVESFGHIPDLNHLGHVHDIFSMWTNVTPPDRGLGVRQKLGV
jgi:hypothetical protein